MQSLSASDAEWLLGHWPFLARAEQLPPDGDWHTWLVLAGRGYGKTRTAAEWIAGLAAEARPGTRIALMGRTAADVRDVMVEGESGILVCSRDCRARYEPSRARVVWESGAQAFMYSAEKPARLRGPVHHYGWGDEVAAWPYAEEMLAMFRFGLRLGQKPRCVLTTTPQPRKVIRDLLADEGVAKTGGSTYDNASNLPPAFLDAVRKKYEGTRLGEQELLARVLDDSPGALLRRAVFDQLYPEPPQLLRAVVALDPAAKSGKGESGQESAATGIIVAGLGVDHVHYVLDDVTLRGKPSDAVRRALRAYHDYGCDRIVAETNNGGDWIETVLRMVEREPEFRGKPRAAYRAVNATRGKHTRAEPVAALYEQGRVRHCKRFELLQDQWCTWNPLGGDPSPDRLDADVWAHTDLMAHDRGRLAVGQLRIGAASPRRTPGII